MRFILYFILYGILFYAIWFFFPDAFNKLVTYAGDVFQFLRGIIAQIIEKITNGSAATPAVPTPPAAPAASFLLGFLVRKN